MVTFTELPQEVLSEIFSHLEYGELKKCMRVNKSFKSFLQQKQFDKVLFRSKKVVSDELSEPMQNNFQLHPVFDRIGHVCTQNIDGVKVISSDKQGNPKITQLIQTAAAKEYATQPPVNAVYLRLAFERPLLVRKKTGVTVLQVMKRLCRYFTPKRQSRADEHLFWEEWDNTWIHEGKLLLYSDSDELGHIFEDARRRNVNIQAAVTASSRQTEQSMEGELDDVLQDEDFDDEDDEGVSYIQMLRLIEALHGQSP